MIKYVRQYRRNVLLDSFSIKNISTEIPTNTNMKSAKQIFPREKNRISYLILINNKIFNGQVVLLITIIPDDSMK